MFLLLNIIKRIGNKRDYREKRQQSRRGQVFSQYRFRIKNKRHPIFPLQTNGKRPLYRDRSKITTESKIGINGISEISDEEKKEVIPDLLRPLVSKAAEVFAYLTGNDNPFPIILNGDLGHNVINLTTKKE